MHEIQFLIAHTATRSYAVRHDDVSAIQMVREEGLPACDAHGQVYVGVELGPLLDPGDRGSAHRQRALIVPLRRKLVALLVEAIDSPREAVGITPLPVLLRGRLEHPWAVGVLVHGDTLLIHLDLRAVARSALQQAAQNIRP